MDTAVCLRPTLQAATVAVAATGVLDRVGRNTRGVTMRPDPTIQLLGYHPVIIFII